MVWCWRCAAACTCSRAWRARVAALLAACQGLALPAVLSFAPTPLAALAAARAGRSLTILSHAQLTSKLAACP